MNALTRKLIRSSGEEIDLPGPVCIAEASRLIGADTLHVVSLADRVHVMLVDDVFLAKGLPVNEEATRRYHETCVPGTTYQIRGDVLIVPDADYGGGL